MIMIRQRIVQLVVSLFLINGLVIGQNEKSSHSCRAKIALNSGDTLLAIENYFKSFQYEQQTPFDYLVAISLLTELNQYEQAAPLIEKVISIGYPFKFLEEKDLNNMKTTTYWDEILLKKDAIVKKHKNSLDQNWVQELKHMTYIDQQMRQVYMRSLRDSVLKQKTLFAMELVDSINFSHLLKLTKEFGFPTYQTVGYDGVYDTWMLLWHHRGVEFSTNPIWQEIRPYIEMEMEIGGLQKDFLVMFIDNDEVEHGRPMIYGSLYAYYRGQPEYDQLSVIDKEKLNERRSIVGLAPMNLWLESLKLPMPEQLKW